MAVARSIQQDFLPESLPETRGVALPAALHPAREVSGDFYDVFTLPPSGAIAMVVGDVCDKGVGAALFMALFRSLIRASADPVGGGAIQMIGGRRTLVRQSLEAATPADLLTRVAGFTNDYIARLHGRTNMFATVFLAILDPMYGHFDYLNAGHEPALVVAPDGSTLALRPTGPALGLLPEQVFTTGQGDLQRDHCLFAFTDGLVEARNPAGEAFGNERLHAALRATGTSAPAVVQGVVDAVRAFSGAAEPHDDLTLLAATRTIVRVERGSGVVLRPVQFSPPQCARLRPFHRSGMQGWRVGWIYVIYPATGGTYGTDHDCFQVGHEPRSALAVHLCQGPRAQG
ncbi:MAG: PP2C family protein-serine/threonine phosphatase, partial [Gemmatimonadales bacterium]